MTSLYNKEKDLNQQLLNSAANGAADDADKEGDGDAGVRVSGNATEQIFRQKFEAEQSLTLKLQDELRDLKAQLNQNEAQTEQMIQQKEKALQQYRDQQDHNTELSKRIDALNEELALREETIQMVKLSKAEVEAEKQHILTQLTEIQNSLQSEESESNKQRIANETQMSEVLERIRGKELVIDQNSHEIRQLQSKLKSQETSIAYFKRQIQELEE